MFSTTYDKEAKLWSGPKIPPTYHPKISLAQVVLGKLKYFGPKIAQISDNNDIQMTFDEMRIKTIRAAQNLQKLGYESKQVFGLIVRNSHHVAPIIFASMSIGCPVNTLDPSFGKTEINHMLNTTKPVLMFCDVECYELVRESLMELGNEAKIFTFGGSKDGAKPVEDLFVETHDEDNFLPVEVDGEKETVVILCSSGTTGLSKGVCRSHAVLLDAIARFDVNTSSDIMLCFSPFYWGSAMTTLLWGTIYGAKRIITTETFTPELQFKLIEKYKVTFTTNSAYHYNLLLKSERITKTDLSSVRIALVGGSKVALHIKNMMNHHLPNGSVHVRYGCSEIGGAITADLPTSCKDTVGRLTSGTQVKIIDDDGNRCGENVDGEICLKTGYKFVGYFGNQKATDDLFDTEGFIKTGDIGHFDEDGYLYLVDRKKELLKYFGFQISPSSIDSYLIESSDIKAACLVGIPDEIAGDIPAAVVVRASGSSISEKEVFDLVADHFADYCKLRGGVYFIDELPTTPSGKVLRRKAKEIAIELYKKRQM